MVVKFLCREQEESWMERGWGTCSETDSESKATFSLLPLIVSLGTFLKSAKHIWVKHGNNLPYRSYGTSPSITNDCVMAAFNLVCGVSKDQGWFQRQIAHYLVSNNLRDNCSTSNQKYIIITVIMAPFHNLFALLLLIFVVQCVTAPWNKTQIIFLLCT